MKPTSIIVRERSTTSVERDVFHVLEDSPHFIQLVDEGVFSLERAKKSGYGVKAGPYVGQALIGNYLVRAEEKVKGSLAALIAAVEHPDAKTADAASFAEDQEAVLYAMIDRFLAQVDRYLTYGREKTYQDRRAKSGLPRGKLLVADTMRLWATGRRDQLVYRYQELSPRTFLNQLVGLALHVVDGILIFSEASRRRQLRTAAMLFEDTGWQELLHLPRRLLDLKCRELDPPGPHVNAMVGLARLLALHFGVSAAITNEQMPFSWFVNLESLFEECVRKSLMAAAKERKLKATDWAAAKRYIFSAEAKYRAQPDVVLWEGATPIVVFDAKYKELSGPSAAPNNPDVYQLVAHAQAWGAKSASLVYPSDHTDVTDLGVGPGGVHVRYFNFDIRSPRQAARDLLKLVVPENAPIKTEAIAAW